ncbi:MAG: type II toxin-antitoxin system VapC family toxin [Proteobacteria bacterium]|nr:type II toxin-antitoxin system VapC family toxin [Pseudomonadota bacterium]MBI3497319.1 type II toxin-antitoxin system VapC family toxin [Pseudomonadota bacterium]
MTTPILLDTHIALWLDSGDAHLRGSTRALIDRHWREGGSVLLSAISAWEIALLVDTGRVELDLPVDAWVRRFIERPGVEAVPLVHEAASASYQLHHFDHRDPADRLLIATAIRLGCPLVTYDERITRFGKRHGQQHRFAVAA